MTDDYHLNALPPGTWLQEYQVERVLGEGSFGIVYLARDKYLEHQVAIKEYLPRELATRLDGATVAPTSTGSERDFAWGLQKFLEEARLLKQLATPQPHPNIVAVRRFFEQHGTAYLVMDFEQGGALSEIIRLRGRLPPADLAALMTALLEGLEAIHAAGITHRDIKPDNILIRPDGTPVFLDFGAARLALGERTQSAFNAMSPAYAALEQHMASDQIGPWTDIYGLGATLYRAVTGNLPQTPLERLVEPHHQPAAAAAGDGYDPRLLAAIDAALTVKPEERPQNVAAWRALLVAPVASNTLGDATVLVGRATPTVSAPRSGPQPAPHPTRGRRSDSLWIAGFGLGAAMLAVAAYFLLVTPSTVPQPTPQPAENPRAAAPDAVAVAALAAKEEAARQAQQAAEEAAQKRAALEAELAAQRAIQEEEARQREAAEAAAQATEQESARQAAEREQAETKRQAELAAQRAAEEENRRLAADAARLEAERQAEVLAQRAAEVAAREAELATREAERQAQLAAEAAARKQAEETARRAAEAASQRQAEIAAQQAAEQTTRLETAEEALQQAKPPAADSFSLAPRNEIQITTRAANVRAAPSTDGARVATLPAGQKVRVTGGVVGRDWLRVTLGDGTSGFVWSPLLRARNVGIAKPPSPPITPTVKQAPAVRSVTIAPSPTARPAMTAPQLAQYLAEHQEALKRKLTAYNRQHRVMVPDSGDIGKVQRLFDPEIQEIRGNRFLVAFNAQVSTTIKIGGPWFGREVFELLWQGGELNFVGHQATALAPLTRTEATGGEAAIKSRQEVEGYLQVNRWRIVEQLSAYNGDHRILVAANGRTKIETIVRQEVVKLTGDRVWVESRLSVGKNYLVNVGEFLIEYQWIGDELAIVDHQKL